MFKLIYLILIIINETNLSYIIKGYELLISNDLTNFNSNNVVAYISHILIVIELLNWNINNVIDKLL